MNVTGLTDNKSTLGQVMAWCRQAIGQAVGYVEPCYISEKIVRIQQNEKK